MRFMFLLDRVVSSLFFVLSIAVVCHMSTVSVSIVGSIEAVARTPCLSIVIVCYKMLKMRKGSVICGGKVM